MASEFSILWSIEIVSLWEGKIRCNYKSFSVIEYFSEIANNYCSYQTFG